MKKPIHYAGPIRAQLKSSFRIVLPGWAACCSGERAERIRERRQHTRIAADVTCAACLRLMAAHEATAKAEAAQAAKEKGK